MGNDNSKSSTEDSFCIFSVENMKEERQVKLKDASACNLKELFGLKLPPETLLDEQGNCIFHKEGSTWSTKLSSGCHYEVIMPKAKVKGMFLATVFRFEFY